MLMDASFGREKLTNSESISLTTSNRQHAEANPCALLQSRNFSRLPKPVVIPNIFFELDEQVKRLHSHLLGVIPGMNAIAFTRRCALLRASKDEKRPWPILRGSPSGASAPQGSHLRMTPSSTL